MSWPDYAILATLLISTLVGALRGFIQEVFSLAIWAAAFVVAYQYGADVALLMEDHVSLPSARAAMGFAGLFVTVLLVGGLLNYLLGRLVESTGLSGTDRLLGGAFGAARGLALVLICLVAAGFTPLPADPWWKESSVIRRMMPLVDWTITFLPGNIQKLLDFEPEPSPAQPPGQEKSKGDSKIDPGPASESSGSRRQAAAGLSG